MLPYGGEPSFPVSPHASRTALNASTLGLIGPFLYITHGIAGCLSSSGIHAVIPRKECQLPKTSDRAIQKVASVKRREARNISRPRAVRARLAPIGELTATSPALHEVVAHESESAIVHRQLRLQFEHHEHIDVAEIPWPLDAHLLRGFTIPRF